MRLMAITYAVVMGAATVGHAGVSSADDLVAVVEGNGRFACDLYRKISEPGGNVFLSPYSISTALAMTYAGARTITEQEMATVLYFSLGQERQHQALGGLQKALGSVHGGSVTFQVANSLWAQDGYRFLPAFLDLTTNRYGAKVFLVDFIRAADVARERINTWAEDKTNGTIKDLIPPGLVTSLTRLVLCNAVYFKAPWQYRFDPAATTDGPFHLTPDSTVTVPMMSQRVSLRLLAHDGFRLAELPYAKGGLSMVIILPDSGLPLESVEHQLTWENLDRWLRDLAEATPQELALMLPRFSMTARYELVETLASMGMPHAFEGADFSGMTGRKDLFISNVIHKAFVDVTEEGTEASAATAVVLKRGGGPASFVVDRPFIFLIREHRTGSILFIGRLVDPLSVARE